MHYSIVRKKPEHNKKIRVSALLLSAALLLAVAVPLRASAAASDPAATIRINGERSAVVGYGSDITVSWSAGNVKECTVTPGNWKELEASKTVRNVTVKQTYMLFCTGDAGTVTAYAGFAVAPPTFDDIRGLLALGASFSPANDNTVKGMTQQVTEAESKASATDYAGAKHLLDLTIAKFNKSVEQGKLLPDHAARYSAAADMLVASWTNPAPVPDPLPEDEVVINKPKNGGYPAKWADLPMDSVVDSWGMYNRQSVSYTAFKVAQDYAAGKNAFNMPFWGGRGNANQWDENALRIGIPVDTNPAPGSIAINNAGIWGHAMYVEKVGVQNGYPAVYVSQYNEKYDGNYSEGWKPVSGLVFIHFEQR